jgi:hypothetical protein
MTQLPLLNKFKLLEVLGVQAAYRTDHSTANTNELQEKMGPGCELHVPKKNKLLASKAVFHLQ